jgi:hypothetical protein
VNGHRPLVVVGLVVKLPLLVGLRDVLAGNRKLITDRLLLLGPLAHGDGASSASFVSRFRWASAGSTTWLSAVACFSAATAAR